MYKAVPASLELLIASSWRSVLAINTLILAALVRGKRAVIGSNRFCCEVRILGGSPDKAIVEQAGSKAGNMPDRCRGRMYFAASRLVR